MLVIVEVGLVVGWAAHRGVPLKVLRLFWTLHLALSVRTELVLGLAPWRRRFLELLCFGTLIWSPGAAHVHNIKVTVSDLFVCGATGPLLTRSKMHLCKMDTGHVFLGSAWLHISTIL